jgi:LacI family transcriptional regulator
MDTNLPQADRRKRVTIKDVARAAGVSTQTVSRVVNHLPSVSPKTRRNVELVVERLGYRPSTLARSLIQQRSYVLGTAVYDLNYIGSSRTLNGIAEGVDELGYMLLMKEIEDFRTGDVDKVIDSLLAYQVDGILWAIPEIGNNHAWIYDHIKNIPVPVLFIAMSPHEGVSSIATDNFQGAVAAIRHLLNCGRRRIGHISGPKGWWEADERRRGWCEALQAVGLEALDQHCVEGDWSPVSGKEAFSQLFEKFPDMDAVFVANDQMALSVLSEASRLSINIPEQLSVIGFDGIPESAYFYPPLTTIYQDFQTLGGQAVQCMVEMIHARQENRSVIPQSGLIQPTLIVRESSALI